MQLKIVIDAVHSCPGRNGIAIAICDCPGIVEFFQRISGIWEVGLNGSGIHVGAPDAGNCLRADDAVHRSAGFELKNIA